jgi:SAM-dependent methyltransferase
MRSVFFDFYDRCDAASGDDPTGRGLKLELGSGSSLFKTRYPDVITSDIKPVAYLDRVIDAQAMPFAADSVWAVYAINTLHHLPDPVKFFEELDRVLVAGGSCVIIEPYYGWLASKFYARVFDCEGFDKTQAEWGNSSLGYALGANQALSYIIFKRDRAKFERLFPRLEIACLRPLTNYPRYFLSGGLNFRQLAPDWSIGAIRAVETLIAPLAPVLALHHLVVLRKKA